MKGSSFLKIWLDFTKNTIIFYDLFDILSHVKNEISAGKFNNMAVHKFSKDNKKNWLNVCSLKPHFKIYKLLFHFQINKKYLKFII